MAQAVKVVNGTLSATSGGTTDFTSSGFGTPSAAIILWCNANTTNNPQNDAEIGVGFWDGTNQRCVAARSTDNVATSATARGSDDSYGVISGPTQTAYTVSSVTDGIRLTLSVDGTALQRYCTVILLIGISASAISITTNTTQNSATTVSGLAFAPELVFFGCIGAGSADIAISTTTAVLSFGFAEIGGVHRMSAWGSQTAQADEVSNILYSESRCVAQITANATTWTGEVTSWNSDGFALTTRDGSSGADVCFALALGGADLSYDVGTLTTATATGVQTNATDVTPQGLLVALTTSPDTSLQTTSTGADGIIFGAADASASHSHSLVVSDGAGTTDTKSYYGGPFNDFLELGSVGNFIANLLVNTDPAVLNTNDFQLDYLTVSATARKGWWVAFGPVPSAGGGVGHRVVGGGWGGRTIGH